MNAMQTEVVASEVVAAPAIVAVTGKTQKEKRLAVVAQSNDFGTASLAAGMAGDVGKAGRQMLRAGVAFSYAKNILSGNYKPVASGLALILGESVIFGDPALAPKGEDSKALQARIRQEWDEFGVILGMMLRKTPSEGKTGKPSPKHKRLSDARALYLEVREAIDSIKAERAARAAQADEAAPQ